MSEAGLIMYHHDRACSHCIRNCSARQTLCDAEGTSGTPIRRRVTNQVPDRLGIVAFSQEQPLGVGQGDRHSHGAAIHLQDFAPSVEIKQIRPHFGGQLHHRHFRLPNLADGKSMSTPPGATVRPRQVAPTLPGSCFVPHCGSAVDSFRERESCGGSAQETGIVLQGYGRDQILFQGHQRNSPWPITNSRVSNECLLPRDLTTEMQR